MLSMYLCRQKYNTFKKWIDIGTWTLPRRSYFRQPWDATYPLAGRACVRAAAGCPTDAGWGMAVGFAACFGLASVNKHTFKTVNNYYAHACTYPYCILSAWNTLISWTSMISSKYISMCMNVVLSYSRFQDIIFGFFVPFNKTCQRRQVAMRD